MYIQTVEIVCGK